MPSTDHTSSDTGHGETAAPRTTSPLAPGAAPADDTAAGDTTPAADAGGLEEKVAEVIAVIRPAIQADDGDIFLRGVDTETGVVSVELVGACITCPVSSQTLKEGLERILRQRVDGVTAVEHVGEELIGASDGTPVSL